MMQGQVALEGMEFYARHGYYEEERKIGNKYTVDVFMKLDVQEAANNDQLEGTVNYEKVYELVVEVMTGKDASLLEHLAGNLIKKLRNQFELGEVTVKISKHNPPIKGLCQKASVTLTG